MGCPEASLIAEVLAAGLMLDGRTFDAIARRPGEGWRTLRHRQLDPAEVAALVLDPAEVIGLRHRHRCRLVAVDVDHHGATPSPYWDPAGQSPALLRLQAEAEAAGLPFTLTRSSVSGGLHVWLALPVAMPGEPAHWLARALLQRAGMEPGPGRCEVFPSSTAYSPGRDAKAWNRRHGVRLPGQAGSALHTGRGWATDPLLPWLELRAALEAAEAGPAWDALVAEAEALMAAHKRARRPRSTFTLPRRHTGTIRHRVRWTGQHQSNRKLFDLTNAAYLQTRHRDPEALAAVVVQLALDCPGFAEHASADTKARLERWAMDKAIWCLANPPTAGSKASTDPHRNQRLRRQASARLAAGAFKAARIHGKASHAWPERKVARFSGVARRTLRKLKTLWQTRLLAALHGLGTHPCPSRGETKPMGDAAEPFSALSDRTFSLCPVTTGRPGLDRLRSPQPLPESVGPADWLQLKRERERAELLAWIGAAGVAA